MQIVRGSQRGLLLPGVAIEHGWEAEEFLNRTCLKAGLPATAWRDDDTQVFRFEGSEHAGKVLSDEEIADWPSAPPLFSPRDVAAYAQFCGETLRTLMQGATPLYYCPSVSDGNVNARQPAGQPSRNGPGTHQHAAEPQANDAAAVHDVFALRRIGPRACESPHPAE